MREQYYFRYNYSEMQELSLYDQFFIDVNINQRLANSAPSTNFECTCNFGYYYNNGACSSCAFVEFYVVTVVIIQRPLSLRVLSKWG